MSLDLGERVSSYAGATGRDVESSEESRARCDGSEERVRDDQ